MVYILRKTSSPKRRTLAILLFLVTLFLTALLSTKSQAATAHHTKRLLQAAASCPTPKCTPPQKLSTQQHKTACRISNGKNNQHHKKNNNDVLMLRNSLEEGKENTNEPQISIYIFYNKSKKTIILNRKQKKDPGASAGWASELNPGRSSALLINKDFPLQCQTNLNTYQTTPCERALNIRHLIKKFDGPIDRQLSSYWLSENKSPAETEKTAISYLHKKN
jgi:hypothetical protein